MRVHYRKGSLLDYDGVYLAEGPWPAKAYFDALRQVRKRDAGYYLDYGYTRPNVVSRGPIEQGCSDDCQTGRSSGNDGLQRTDAAGSDQSGRIPAAARCERTEDGSAEPPVE